MKLPKRIQESFLAKSTTTSPSSSFQFFSPRRRSHANEARNHCLFSWRFRAWRLLRHGSHPPSLPISGASFGTDLSLHISLCYIRKWMCIQRRLVLQDPSRFLQASGLQQGCKDNRSTMPKRQGIMMVINLGETFSQTSRLHLWKTPVNQICVYIRIYVYIHFFLNIMYISRPHIIVDLLVEE